MDVFQTNLALLEIDILMCAVAAQGPESVARREAEIKTTVKNPCLLLTY